MNVNAFFRPRMTGLEMPNLDLNLTHPTHIAFQRESFLGQGGRLVQMGQQIGAGAATRGGTFEQAMLQALDRVNAFQQISADLHQAAIVDPGSVNVHDITIAQAQASMSLDITRNVLNRVVQGWRDLINTR
jgi:flagellar hook-basal body complex protein FliE